MVGTSQKDPEIDAEKPEPDDDNDEDEEGAETREEHTLFDELVSDPHSDDVLLYGLPVCAPYSAMQRFKFKV
jgi:hypothetical protein